jgi:hypothetical protein
MGLSPVLHQILLSTAWIPATTATIGSPTKTTATGNAQTMSSSHPISDATSRILATFVPSVSERVAQRVHDIVDGSARNSGDDNLSPFGDRADSVLLVSCRFDVVPGLVQPARQCTADVTVADNCDVHGPALTGFGGCNDGMVHSMRVLARVTIRRRGPFTSASASIWVQAGLMDNSSWLSRRVGAQYAYAVPDRRGGAIDRTATNV